jgi:hypothetical protein
MSNTPVILAAYAVKTMPLHIFIAYTGLYSPGKVYVVYRKSDEIIAELAVDTSRKTAGEVNLLADTRRGIATNAFLLAATLRDMTCSKSILSSTGRYLTKQVSAIYDTDRAITGATYAVNLLCDTFRKIDAVPCQTFDVQRIISKRLEVATDTARSITGNTAIQADTTRLLTHMTYKAELIADTAFSIVQSPAIKADAGRFLRYTSLNCHDTSRIPRVDTGDIISDTCRILCHEYDIHADTLRTLEYQAKDIKPQSISIELSKGQLTDTFTMVTPVDMDLEMVIKGKLLDWDYRFKAYESSGQGLMRTITGMYDIDRLLYTPFTYSYTGASTAKAHAARVAAMMGKQLAWHADDFTPSASFSGINGATLQNIIGGLFGWAGNVPQDWINVLLRGDSLKVIQRGHEPNTIDLTHAKHSRPSIDRRLMRSVWSGTVGGHSARKHITIEPLGFYGTIRYGESMVTYVDGLVTREVTKTAEGTTTSTYDYTDGYLTKKVTVTPDEIITTTYDYAITLNDRYLASEKAATKEKDGNTTSETLTQHVYLGNGWYGTTVYVDGEFNNSSVSNGKPGGKASKYIVDQSNLNLGGKYPDNSDESYQGAALFDTSFPISDTATLKKLTKDIEWLNRKTEEKVSMDIWQYPHLIDFTDRILFNGAAYFLESNQVTQTPKELKQTVTMIRWY